VAPLATALPVVTVAVAIVAVAELILLLNDFCVLLTPLPMPSAALKRPLATRFGLSYVAELSVFSLECESAALAVGFIQISDSKNGSNSKQSATNKKPIK
jgi:hypothetical protein